MSRMSALTTFRLIGSPTKPGCPYCLPWSDCAILSAAAEIATTGVGVGEGEGFCCGAAAACWLEFPEIVMTFAKRKVVALITAATGAPFVTPRALAPNRHRKSRTSVVLSMAAEIGD